MIDNIEENILNSSPNYIFLTRHSNSENIIWLLSPLNLEDVYFRIDWTVSRLEETSHRNRK